MLNLVFARYGAIVTIMQKKENTLERGAVRCLVYQLLDDKNIYYATALEFNLTVSAEDKYSALLDLQEQIEEYISIAREKNTPQSLNQKVDPDLEKVWFSVISNDSEQNDKSKQTHQCIPIAATSELINAIAV